MSDINAALGRTAETFLQSINFEHLSTLRQTLLNTSSTTTTITSQAATTTSDRQAPSHEDRINAVKQRLVARSPATTARTYPAARGVFAIAGAEGAGVYTGVEGWGQRWGVGKGFDVGGGGEGGGGGGGCGGGGGGRAGGGGLNGTGAIERMRRASQVTCICHMQDAMYLEECNV